MVIKIRRVVLAGFLTLSFVLGGPPAGAAASSSGEGAPYEREERIDEAFGFLSRLWRFDLVRIPTRRHEPREVRPGLPPYLQQAEEAQRLPGAAAGTR